MDILGYPHEDSTQSLHKMESKFCDFKTVKIYSGLTIDLDQTNNLGRKENSRIRSKNFSLYTPLI